MQIIELIRSHRTELDARGIQRVLLFGSSARDDATVGSDVDLLVE